MTHLFLHPTQVICLDDDMAYLNNLSLTLPSDQFSYQLFSDSNEALNFIEDNSNHFDYDNFIEVNEVEYINTGILLYDIPSIHKISENTKRLNQISTLIVDYDMPKINGIEFLKKIKNKNIQKILLTGQADEQVAVEAFNQGIIHQYIKKRNIESDLNKAIIQSQKNYFFSITNKTIGTLASKFESDSALTDEVFLDYYNKICENNEIIEAYLLDPIGSYLMKNRIGETFILHVQNEDLADSYYFDISNQDEDVISREEKEYIQSKKKIFCYRTLKNEKLPDPSLWGPYFRDAVYINGKYPFYCHFQAIDSSLLSPELKKEFSQYI